MGGDKFDVFAATLCLHVHTLLRLVAASTLEADVAVGADGAYTDCPCIDHVGDHHWASFLVAGRYRRVENGTAFLTDTSGEILDNSYGSGICRPWDVDRRLPKCQQAFAPKWCTSSWCFVNRTNCGRPFEAAKRFDSFAYSYAACGFLNSYVTDDLQLQRSTQQRPYKAWSWDLARASLEPKGQSGGDLWPGAIASLKMAYYVLLRVGIQPESLMYRNLSNASTTQYPESSYTACVHDIAIGNLDFCLGDFWQTDERMLMGVAFAPVFTENVALVVPTGKNPQHHFNLFNELKRPLAPFTWSLWGSILAVLFVSALAMAFFEGGKEGGDFSDYSNRTHCARGMHSMYLSAMSFCTASICFTPVTKSGRIFGMSLAFFILIVLASFTANTAAFLTFQGLPDAAVGIRSLADALAQNKRICVRQPLVLTLKEKYPDLRRLAVTSDLENSKPTEGMEKGWCDAKLAVESDIWNEWGGGRACNFQIVGGPVMTYMTGFFFKDEVRQATQYAVAEKRTDGTWSKLETDFRPPNSCPGPEQNNQSTGPQQMTPVNMLGNFLILLVCLVASLIMFFIDKHAGSKLERAANNIERALEGAIEDAVIHQIEKLEDAVGEVEARVQHSRLPSVGRLPVVPRQGRNVDANLVRKQSL